MTLPGPPDTRLSRITDSYRFWALVDRRAEVQLLTCLRKIFQRDYANIERTVLMKYRTTLLIIIGTFLLSAPAIAQQEATRPNIV